MCGPFVKFRMVSNVPSGLTGLASANAWPSTENDTVPPSGTGETVIVRICIADCASGASVTVVTVGCGVGTVTGGGGGEVVVVVGAGGTVTGGGEVVVVVGSGGTVTGGEDVVVVGIVDDVVVGVDG